MEILAGGFGLGLGLTERGPGLIEGEVPVLRITLSDHVPIAQFRGAIKFGPGYIERRPSGFAPRIGGFDTGPCRQALLSGARAIGACRFQFRPSLGELLSVGRIVQPDEQGALLGLLEVPDRDLGDPSGHLRREESHLSAHIGVLCHPRRRSNGGRPQAKRTPTAPMTPTSAARIVATWWVNF